MHLKRLKLEITEEVTKTIKTILPEIIVDSSKTLQEIICVTKSATYIINLTFHDDQQHVNINTSTSFWYRSGRHCNISSRSNTTIPIEIENPNFIQKIAQACTNIISHNTNNHGH